MKLYQCIYFFIFFNINILGFKNQNNYSYINNNITEIQEAIYIIRNSEGNLALEFIDEPIFKNDKNPLKKF